MDKIIYIITAPLFLISLAGYFYVKIRLRPRDPELDDYYHELEDSHPELAKYNKWSQVTFTVAVVAALAMFLVIIL